MRRVHLITLCLALCLCLGVGVSASGVNLARLSVLEPSGIVSGDDYGWATAAEGSLAVVSAPRKSNTGKPNAGLVYCFTHDGSEWVFSETKGAAIPVENDGFGLSVALSSNWMAVGTVNSEVHLYKHSLGVWQWK
ncbi:hypothetical protein KIPB_001816, partial [Kipferlia bialata]|eukprot:g1816.t1